MSARTLLAFTPVLTTVAGLIACEDVTNLDVKYSSSPAAVDAGAEAEAGEPIPVDPGGNELQGCPCDLMQGLACCVSAAGPAFCTTDQDRCIVEHGAFYKCFEPDPLSESACCWSGAGEGAVTAYAAECKGGRPAACTKDSQCGGASGTCHLVVCHGVRVGACGADPVCPP